MRKVMFAAVMGCALALGLSASPANATLHGWCGSGVTSTCLDNGTNSPSSLNPPNPFGFTSSPPNQTGTLFIAVLVPDNEANVLSYAISGAVSTSASLVSFTPWTSGQLDAYLGVSASPNNPIGAFLPSTQGLDPGATGFFVYAANVGTQTLAGPGGPPNQLFDIEGLPLASYIIGFMDLGPNGVDATANSGAIFITAAVSVPEPATMLVLGSGILGIGLVRRYRRPR